MIALALLLLASPPSHVMDQANVIPDATEHLLNQRLESFENTHKVEIVVATFDSLGGRPEHVVGPLTAREWAIAVVVFGLVAGALLLLGGRGDASRKAALYGACAGVLYGLSASLCKPTVEILDDSGLSGVLESWELYAFAAAGILAFVVQQVSLSTGNLAASVATVSVCNPLVSILIGTLLLDERLAEPLWHKTVAYVGLGIALLGAVVISLATEGAKEQRSSAPVPAPAS